MNIKIAPPKNDGIAVFYFALQGMGTLISFNAVLNGLDYFATQYGNYQVPFLLPLAVNIAQFIANFFLPKISSSFSLKARMYAPLTIASCILIFLPIEANIFSGKAIGFYLIMALVSIMGFCNCVYQGSISGFASQFPGKYVSWFLMGTGLAGCVMNILRSIAILCLSNTTGGPLLEIVTYFIAAGIILIICIGIHPVFIRSEICQYYTRASLLGLSGSESSSDAPLVDSMSADDTSAPSSPGVKKDLKTVLTVFKMTKFFVLCLFLNYVLSFLVYPGVLMENPMKALTADWKLVSILFVFNVCDVLGKNIAQYRNLYNKWGVFAVIVLRMAFIGLMVVQALTSQYAIISSLWLTYVNIGLFGLTNGFVTTALFILGPEAVQGALKEIAGFLSIFGLTTGIAVGGLLALTMQNLNAHNM
jgi:equilibrative nucleoside transporter 1/2/3